MNKQELIMNAIDSNGFQPNATAAGYINPTFWNTQVLQFLQAVLVVSKEAKVYNDLLGQSGASLNVTINSAPGSASKVASSDDVTVSAYSVTQVTFTPAEYAYAFALHDTEARRAFYDVATDMSRKIGYALALKRDSTAVTLLQASAGNTVIVNGVAATSSLASSDTITFSDIVNVASKVRSGKMIPRTLILSVGQFGQVSKLTQFSYANQAGNTDDLYGGVIGRVYGMSVAWTTQIAVASNVSKAICLGVDMAGEPSFGIAMKANPTIRTQRFELGRYTNIVGVEEWDMEMLRTAGVALLASYDA